MKPIQIQNGVIVYYGNRVGMIQDGKAVVDPMFERKELKAFLECQYSIQHVKWKSGIFDRLMSQPMLSFEQAAMKHVRVWQLKPDVDICMKFICYEEMCKQFGPPCEENYKIVYDGIAQTNDLEELYMKFHTKLPDGYTGHSLSMSDILELYDEHGSTFYYVDRIGFQQVEFEQQSQTISNFDTMQF